MKKKCMAVGGTAKKPATMEEQLAGIRGKVRPGYQAGGIAGIDYPRSFSGQFPVRQPLGAGLGATAIQSGEYAVNAPGSIPQSLGLLGAPDYSTGPRQGGFVYEDGTPRPSQNGNEETQSAKRGQLSEQIDMGQAMAGLSNTERYKLGGSGTSAEVSEINQRNDILKTLNASLQPTQQIQVGRAPRPGIVGGIEEQLIKRGRNGFADGGIIDKLIRAVGRVLPDSNGQKYEPGIQSRASEDPARHGRAEALNPRTQTASSDTPPAGGFQEEAERRRKQMREAMEYACGTARVGHAAGGIVRGKGGPTDDQVPMSVGGTPVNLSPREAVLPVKTVMALGGPDAVEDLIERTNGKPPVRSGLRAGGNYAAGAGGIEIPDDYMRGRQPPPVQPTVPPLTPEQEMLKRAAASRAADAQARAAQEASQAARSAEAGMRTPGGAAQAAPSRMSKLRAALNPANATKIEDIPRMIKEGGAKLAGSKVGSVVAEVGKRAPSAGPALAGLEGAVRGINTTDAEYAQRLGVDEPTTRLGSIAVRAPGVLSDVGASVINGAALPYNLVRHGLNFNNYYDYRDNFDDVASAKAQAAAAPVVAAKSAAPAGQSQAPASAQTGTQGAPEPAMAAAADIQARSMAAEGLRGFAQRRMNLPSTQQQDVVNGGSLVQRGNVGLRAIGSDQGTMNALNEAHGQQGTGVTYSTVKSADGKPQVMISGGQPTKPQYIAADGTPTNDWKQTAQYAESKGLYARNKQALRDIEMENARGDMASALPFYQGRGLRTMATRLREDELGQKGQITPAQAAQLAMQREGLDATIANRAEDNARADAAARAGESEAHRKATDDLIKSWATEDGKLNDQKYAFLQKYASQFERPKGMSSAEHLGNLMDEFAIDTMGDTEGRHWLASEGTWGGERTKWQKRAAKDSLRRGAPLQSVEYHDPLTGRTIYQSDVNKLSPKQRKLFESRVYQ